MLPIPIECSRKGQTRPSKNRRQSGKDAPLRDLTRDSGLKDVVIPDLLYPSYGASGF